MVPVWITLPRLPVHFFQRDPLFAIARLVGNPLRLDAATAALKRPSVARLQVEVDLLNPLHERVWIQMGTKEGFWQKIEFEDVPSYCRHCWHVGHSESMCHVHNPELKDSSDKRNVIAAPSSSWQYVPKQRQPAPGVPKIADTGGHQAAVLPHNLDKSVASDVAIAAPEVATSVKEPILDSEAVPENTRPKDDAAVHVNDPSPSTNASSPSMKEPLLVSEAAVREVSDRVAMTPIIVAQDAPGILTQQPSERSPIGDASSVLLEQEAS